MLTRDGADGLLGTADFFWIVYCYFINFIGKWTSLSGWYVVGKGDQWFMWLVCGQNVVCKGSWYLCLHTVQCVAQGTHLPEISDLVTESSYLWVADVTRIFMRHIVHQRIHFTWQVSFVGGKHKQVQKFFKPYPGLDKICVWWSGASRFSQLTLTFLGELLHLIFTAL